MGRLDPFGEPTANVRYLREGDVAYRRFADIACRAVDVALGRRAAGRSLRRERQVNAH
jgi:hypothetical protein